MRLTDALNRREARLLVTLLVVFNAIPVIGGSIVFLTTFVINFGVALIVQMTATVVCLAFVVPTVLVCSTAAVALFLLIRVASEYVDYFADGGVESSRAPTVSLEQTTTVIPQPLSPRHSHLNMKLD